MEVAPYDNASVQVSNDRVNWTTVWHNTATVDDTGWQQEIFDISAVADNQATVYIRWGMGPTDGSVTYAGWNLDDVRVNDAAHALHLAIEAFDDLRLNLGLGMPLLDGKAPLPFRQIRTTLVIHAARFNS